MSRPTQRVSLEDVRALTQELPAGSDRSGECFDMVCWLAILGWDWPEIRAAVSLFWVGVDRFPSGTTQ